MPTPKLRGQSTSHDDYSNVNLAQNSRKTKSLFEYVRCKAKSKVTLQQIVTHNGEEVTDATQIAEAFNEQFSINQSINHLFAICK